MAYGQGLLRDVTRHYGSFTQSYNKAMVGSNQLRKDIYNIAQVNIDDIMNGRDLSQLRPNELRSISREMKDAEANEPYADLIRDRLLMKPFGTRYLTYEEYMYLKSLDIYNDDIEYYDCAVMTGNAERYIGKQAQAHEGELYALYENYIATIEQGISDKLRVQTNKVVKFTVDR